MSIRPMITLVPSEVGEPIGRHLIDDEQAELCDWTTERLLEMLDLARDMELHGATELKLQKLYDARRGLDATVAFKTEAACAGTPLLP